MHLKTTNKTNSTKNMASLQDDGDGQQHQSAAATGGGSSTTENGKRITNHNNNNNNNYQSSNNNNNNTNSKNNNNNNNEDDVKTKKQTLETRKQELERMLSEKSWLLQQIKKQESEIMNGNYEYSTINEFFANLAQQYKHEQLLTSGSSSTTTGAGGRQTPDSAILRRKHSNASKENQQFGGYVINNNSNNNRNSEVSNRSSEYDNYQPNAASTETNLTIGVQQTQQLPIKSALKKRATPSQMAAVASSSSSSTMNMNYMRQQHQQHILLQQHIELYPYAVSVPVAQQTTHNHHPQQRTPMYGSPQQSPIHNQHQQPAQFDAISLYSVNSANVATLRQQHVAPQQQPIIVQCDKYYLSPTHQSYNEGGFIKSSQNIKKYVSPLSSPTTHHYEMPQTLQQPLQQQMQQHRQLDAISLAPSYVSMDAESIHQLRWRSQTHIGPLTPPSLAGAGGSIGSASHMDNAKKAHSSDMLANISNSQQQHHYSHSPLGPPAPPPPLPATTSMHHASAKQAKPLDEISLSSLNSDKKSSKSKQWLESSLDGPVIRNMDAISTTSHHSGNHTKQPRERTKLSSQSMSASGGVGRHYSMSSARNPVNSGGSSHHMGIGSGGGGTTTAALNTSGLPTKMLQHDDGRYTKLSQSTSYLNSMEQANGIGISASYPLEPLDIPALRQLPPKPNAAAQQHQHHHHQQQQQPTPPPRPPPAVDKSSAPTPLTSPPVVAAAAALSPDIRIESPKNMTIVQQATFQPYKEVTKPFEMSDFYKYSTKFKQKEQTTNNRQVVTPTIGGGGHMDGI